MTLTAEFFLPAESWIHRLDPRIKILFVLLSVFTALWMQNLWLMLLLLLGLVLLHHSASIPFQRLWLLARALLPVSLLMFLLRVLFYPEGELLFEIGVVNITGMAMIRGAVFGLRLLVMSYAVMLWLYTTESTVIITSFVQLGLPYSWGLSLGLALRYIPFFQDTYRMISHAQQARGLDLQQVRGIRRLRRMMPVLIPLMISSFRASQEMAQALEARAFGLSGVHRTSLYELKLQSLDYLGGLTTLLFFGTLLYSRLAFGLGAALLAPLP